MSAPIDEYVYMTIREDGRLGQRVYSSEAETLIAALHLEDKYPRHTYGAARVLRSAFERMP